MPLQRSNVDAGQIEALVRKHFGEGFTCFVTRNHASGRYVKAASPDVVGRPRKVLFLTLGYEVIGQFKDENGDAFEFYREWEAAHPGKPIRTMTAKEFSDACMGKIVASARLRHRA